MLDKEHKVNPLSLQKDLKKIIGKVWFVRNDFKYVVQNEFLLRRAKLIQDVVELMADYNPEKDDFADRLVLDNYLGSIQHYLTGYDLSSIHLSSKSLEVAFLFKIGSPCKGERWGSFGDLCNISISRGLIKQKEAIAVAWNVVNRRNMTMHDAILEQTLLWISEEWVQGQLGKMPSKYRSLAETILKPLMSELQNRLRLFNSLPDLRWYVMDRSFESTKKLIIDFLEEAIGKTLIPMGSIEGEGVKTFLIKLSKIPELIKNVKLSILYELDFIEYSARQNIQDVKTVLNELCVNQIFRF